jgi:cytoskeletal protein CcmA (bactofilin family)
MARRSKRGPVAQQWRALVVGVLVLLGMVAVSTVALAQQTQTALDEQLRSGANVTVSSDETIDGDLYASGGQVRVDGMVNGDLVVAGGQIDVTGDVTGDLLAAGGTITVAGAVDGDARMAGGQIRIDGVIGEDLAVTSGQLVIGAGGLIGDNLLFSTGQTTFGGTVDGSVRGLGRCSCWPGACSGDRFPQPRPPRQSSNPWLDRRVPASPHCGQTYKRVAVIQVKARPMRRWPSTRKPASTRLVRNWPASKRSSCGCCSNQAQRG